MSAEWTKQGPVAWAMINQRQYEIYETEPGIQRLRRDGELIAETFTTEEAMRWAEVYDTWLEREEPKLPRRPSRFVPLTFEEDWTMIHDAPRLPRYPNDMGAKS